jgi:lysophospholipase L1-like esterase
MPTVAGRPGLPPGNQFATDTEVSTAVTTHAVHLKPPLLVFDGDSLTSGTGSTFGRNYPAQTVEGLDARTTVYNYGVGGQTMSQMTADAVSQVDSLFDSTMNGIVLPFGGTNDLNSGVDQTAATCYSRIVAYHTARQSAGWRTVAFTILPRTDAGYSETHEANRLTVNTSIRDNWEDFADALVDVAADSRIGDVADTSNTTYYYDLVHLTNAGYAIVADLTRDALGELGVTAAHDHTGYATRQEYLWLDATRFAVQYGSPTLQVSSNYTPCWAMDADTEESVGASVVIPQGWTTYSVHVWYTNLGAGSGAVYWVLLYGVDKTEGSSIATGASTFRAPTAPAENIIDSEQFTGLGGGTGVLTPTLYGPYMQTFRIQRQASSAPDTLGNDAGFLGLMLKRES